MKIDNFENQLAADMEKILSSDENKKMFGKSAMIEKLAFQRVADEGKIPSEVETEFKNILGIKTASEKKCDCKCSTEKDKECKCSCHEGKEESDKTTEDDSSKTASVVADLLKVSETLEELGLVSLSAHSARLAGFVVTAAKDKKTGKKSKTNIKERMEKMRKMKGGKGKKPASKSSKPATKSTKSTNPFASKSKTDDKATDAGGEKKAHSLVSMMKRYASIEPEAIRAQITQSVGSAIENKGFMKLVQDAVANFNKKHQSPVTEASIQIDRIGDDNSVTLKTSAPNGEELSRELQPVMAMISGYLNRYPEIYTQMSNDESVDYSGGFAFSVPVPIQP